jgi:DNA-binding transcriptional MocR family regulator
MQKLSPSSTIAASAASSTTAFTAASATAARSGLSLRTFRYQALAERFADAISSGALAPGDALPSVRALCRIEKVSPATVLEAYARLEASGLVAAKPKSGFYVLSKPRQELAEPGLSPPAAAPTPVNLGDRVAQMLSPDRNARLIPLGAAVPALGLLPTAALNRFASQALRDGALDLHGYDLPPGSLELRRQIARRGLRLGMNLDPDDLVITSGCLEALNLSLRAVCRPGDIVAIESPSYFAMLQALENLGIFALEIPTHARTGIDLPSLQVALRRHKVRAVLLSPNFSNPLGSLMPDENKRELLTMLEKRSIPLIEDDVHGDLHFGPDRPRPVKAFDTQGLVLHCSSFSKTLAPGARVGWVSPGRYLDAVMRLKIMNTLAAPSIPQAMLAKTLASGAYDKHLRRLRPALEGQVMRMLDAVGRHFPEGTRASRPQGSFNLWVELPRKVARGAKGRQATPIDALRLTDLAAEQGISIAPGPIFSARGRFGHCIRLSCGNPFTESIEAAVATLGRLAANG